MKNIDGIPRKLLQEYCQAEVLSFVDDQNSRYHYSISGAKITTPVITTWRHRLF